MKMIEYGIDLYNLETAINISFPSAFENEIEISFIDGSKVKFVYNDVFSSTLNEFYKFIKDPEATYFELDALEWHKI